MKTIDFVTRTRAGATQYGSVPADRNVTSIPVEPGQEMSLNLQQVDIQSYARSGRDLQITLADGRVLVLEGYFSADGAAEGRLFISANGVLNEITLSEGQDGAIYAQYEPTSQWSKWSSADDLIFLNDEDRVIAPVAAGDEQVSMLGAGVLGGSGLLTALGLGGAAVAASQVIPEDKDGGARPIRIEPGIDQDTNITIGGDDAGPAASEITISGTAEPGSNVKVSVGDKTQETTSGDDGTWDVTFSGDTFPGDGDHPVVVVVTEPDGRETTLNGPNVVIDTTPPDTDITGGTATGGEVANAEEFDNGIEITGTGEPGASISVTVEGVTRETSVSETGTWSVTYEKGSLREGEYSATVTVLSTDAAGNTTTVTDTMTIDTVANTVTITTALIEGDGVINAAERDDGVTLIGTATPGAEVVVTIQGVSQTVTASNTGSWTATFAANTLPQGTYDSQITATSTDAAGNINTTTGTVRVDTQVDNFAVTSRAGGADQVINGTEAQSGLVVTGTSEPGSFVVVTLGTQTVNAVVGGDGSWTASFAAAQIAPGTYTTTMTAVATDAAGNSSTITGAVNVDTDAGSLTLNAGAIGGDGTINNAEALAGVAVTGTADPGAVVTVTLDGVTHQAVANGAGQWTTTYLNHEITPGDHEPQVTATITDAAGNTASVTGTVQVDTRVDNLNLTPPQIATAADGSDVINNAIAAAGFDVTGTVEAGSTVSVTIGGVTRQATVDANGNWTAGFLPGDVPGGEYDAALRVDVIDSAGNTSRINDTVRVDTRVNTLSKSAAPIETDNVVNAAEAVDGVTVTGQVEPGSTVTVQVLGKTYNAAVAANGEWTLDIPGADIPTADQTFPMIITARDAAGNSSAINDSLVVDTVVPDQPDIVGYFREVDGYRNATIETTQEDITIYQVEAGGNVNQMQLHETSDAFLNESTYFFLNTAGTAPQKIPDGSQLVITGTDTAGNAASTYVVLDEVNTNVVDLSNGNLGAFNIETVDLRFGDQSQLTLNETLVKGLSGNTDALLVRGGADDTLTIQGATRTGGTTVDGEAHSVYMTAGGASVIVDDDINTSVI